MVGNHWTSLRIKTQPYHTDQRQCVEYFKFNNQVDEENSSWKIAWEIEGMTTGQAQVLLENCYETVIVNESVFHRRILCFGPIDHDPWMEDLDMDMQHIDSSDDDMEFMSEQEEAEWEAENETENGT